eukprot:5582238-Amphidinium_carterae.1
MAAAAMAELRWGLQRHKRPKWMVRVARQLPPLALEELLYRPRLLAFWWRCVGDRIREQDAAFTYTLWTRHCLYIGKTNWRRHDGTNGLQARLAEHVRGFLAPESRDGGLPRYRLLRRSGVGTLRFNPSQLWQSSARALAAESVAILLEHPECNVSDMRKVEQMRAMAPPGLQVDGHAQAQRPMHRARRNRPPAWRRHRKQVLESIWANPITTEAIGKDRLGSTRGGVMELRAPYPQLYRYVQQEVLAVNGEVGPLFIFAHLPLYIAYLTLPYAQFRACLPRWTRASLAKLLYMAAHAVEHYVKQPRR